jgi:hypothetical protein
MLHEHTPATTVPTPLQDDVWQLCGSYGPENYTYHDTDGNPVVDTSRFPNMSALPATAHSLGLTAGFYCIQTTAIAATTVLTLSALQETLKLSLVGASTV